MWRGSTNAKLLRTSYTPNNRNNPFSQLSKLNDLHLCFNWTKSQILSNSHPFFKGLNQLLNNLKRIRRSWRKTTSKKQKKMIHQINSNLSLINSNKKIKKTCLETLFSPKRVNYPTSSSFK